MFTHKGRAIEKVAVIGSGQIGPDIALHFSKVFTPYGVPVVVIDVAEDALAKGEKRVHKKINKGIESGAFKPDAGEAMKKNITFTTDYEAARGASFVVEAASENADIKGKIFAQLEGMVSDTAVLASNSSHMEPEVIFAGIESKRRTLVTHYFFPAERNPVVEVVPGENTGTGVTAWVTSFYEEIGKMPIVVKSRYGYAMDPIFEGLFQAAAMCVEEGLGTVKEVDSVTRKSLRMGVGPFTAMNLTGGNPITHHGLEEMGDKIMPWFNSPQLMADAMESGRPWDVPGRDEKVEVEADRATKITERMMGAYFGLVCEILDSGISNLADLEMAVPTSLVVAPPFAMMNKTGVQAAHALVETYAADHPGFHVSKLLEKQAEKNAPWKIPVILREDRDGVALVTIRRPAAMNSMNATAIGQLGEVFADIKNDSAIKAAVLTGYGKKVFVSGADIKFLSTLDTPEAAENMCHTFQGSVGVIEDLGKPVVAALNGIAFGGGCEIGMGCHARIAKKGMRVLAGQPEVNLGIIPGAGGTQRLPRIVGFEVGGELLRTGKPISADRALEIGLVDRLSEDDLIDDAIALANEIVEGTYTPTPMPKDPVDAPDALPDVDIGHLSTAVDAILVRATLEGGRMSLEDGLKLEAKLFAEVCETEDSKIGINNFIEKGAKSKAEFKNR